jgi:hypothetical protein
MSSPRALPRAAFPRPFGAGRLRKPPRRGEAQGVALGKVEEE